MRAMQFARISALTVAAIAARAQTGDGLELLRKISAAFRQAESHWLEADIESELLSDRSRSISTSTLVTAKDGPGRIRFETVESTGAHTVVSGGGTLWVAAPDNREFVRTTVTGPIAETKNLGPEANMALQRMRFLSAAAGRLEDDLISAERRGTEALDFGPLKVECAVIVGTYRPRSGATGIESWTRTFWIDESRSTVLREVSVTKGKLSPSQPFLEMTATHRRSYRVASLGSPPPERLFVYEPPANFVQVDRLEHAFPRIAKDLIGKPAPDLAGRTLAGDSLRLADLRGKVVLLDFWAAWCEPCRRQMPAIAKLRGQTSARGVVVVGVNDDTELDKARQFVSEHGYDWAHLVDPEARGKFKIQSIPTLVLIGRDGVIAAIHTGAGAATESAIREAMRKLGVPL